MSSITTTEEDTELRDLVAATLENTGILGRIKAQLRANVYLALEEGEKVRTKSKLVNPKLSEYLSTTNGRLVAGLVREFLEFFSLDFTLTVFDPETNIGKDVKLRERSKLTEALGLTELTDHKAPLLAEILRLSKVSVLKSESPTPTEISDDGHTSAVTSINEDDKSEVIKSETSDEPTPELVIKDSSLDKSLDFLKNPSEGKRNVNTDNGFNKSKDTFLSDLPPLGVGKSSLSDLPPLTSGKNLAPLSKIPPKHPGNISDPFSKTAAVAKTNPEQPIVMKKVIESVPRFGFDYEHVISDKSEVNSDATKHDDDVTENIEEELDSFLHSDMSGGDATKDETVHEDASLKADYIESL